MKKLDCWPLRRVMGLSRGLGLTALAVVALAWVMDEIYGQSTVRFAVFGGLAILLAVVGLVVANIWLRCPHCGASLCSGWRLPWSLPRYCPACGKDLEKAED